MPLQPQPIFGCPEQRLCSVRLAVKGPNFVSPTHGFQIPAAIAMLDERHEDLPNPITDHNAYTLGSMSNHNVVIACLPRGGIGTSPTATVATRLMSSFPSIRFGLMVGRRSLKCLIRRCSCQYVCQRLSRSHPMGHGQGRAKGYFQAD
ncbi:hypothetical protein BDW69DRAFT_177885 [Aspergillus filifer]